MTDQDNSAPIDGGKTAGAELRHRKIGVAGIQMSVTAGESNVARIERLVAYTKWKFPWIDVVLFSELCVFGPDPRFAEPFPGETLSKLCAIAAASRVWLIPGSMFEVAGADIFNTAPVINSEGVVVAKHRKLFPFLPYEQGTTPGKTSTLVDLGIGRFGVSICYDMWFPETTRDLATNGACLILHPTLTDTIDRTIEHSIARASAATNQCYFFDINGIGDGGVGRSIVVDPAGYTLHEAGQTQEIIPIMVDFDLVDTERKAGIRGLGQPLKSFRDRSADFTVYDSTRADPSYLASLGPLVKQRGYG